MSIGGSMGSSKSKTKSEPWAPTQPALMNIVNAANPLIGNAGVTPGQQTAYDQLKTNAAAGNPAAGQIRDVATGALTYDNTPQKTMVSDAYSNLQGSLGKYAGGDYLDVANNPELRALMDVVGTDIQDRTNRSFAAAGRDMSGMNQQAVARGVSQGTAGLLLDQFNKQQGMQIDAASKLYAGGTGAAGQMSQLDQLLQQIRGGGIAHADKALAAENYGPNAMLQLEQQMKNMPVEDLALIASLITPIAGLGGTSNTSGSSSSIGLKIG